MKKRIVCVLLTLIMLLSLVPMGASAASHTTSDAAITVLKQMTVFKDKCYHFNGQEFRTGYGTVCNKTHHFAYNTVTKKNEPDNTKLNKDGTVANYHYITETNADKALREALKEIDKKVCSFESTNKLSLKQNQHDALVVFSFVAGTDWMQGNGVLKSAIVGGCNTTDMLNAINKWTNNASQSRCYVVVNMYQNGVYSNSVPSNFGKVTYNAGVGGTLAQGNSYTYYYDVNTSVVHPATPTKAGSTFLGWYANVETGKPVWAATLNHIYNNHTLVALWQVGDEAVAVDYHLAKGQLAELVAFNVSDGKANTDATKKLIDDLNDDGYVRVDKDVIDSSGTRWSHPAGYGNVRIKVGKASTNSYNDSVGTVIGTATVTINGYLNLRSEPGTDSKIVGALAKNDTVNIYEIKTVNGHQWGRSKSGWLCLTYTRTILKDDAKISDVGVSTYAFTGTVNTDNLKVHVEPGSNTNFAFIYVPGSDPSKDMVKQELVLKQGLAVTVTNLFVVNNDTWAKITWSNPEWSWKTKNAADGKNTYHTPRSGWVMLTSMTDPSRNDVALNNVKFTVAADKVNVRSKWGDASPLAFTLNKGVEVEVTQVALVSENIWGRIVVKKNSQTGAGADEVGYVNLASKYLTRKDAPVVADTSNKTSKQIGTVINTDSLKVRDFGATYGARIDSLSRGTTVAIWESNEDGWYKVDSNKNGVYDYDADGWVFGTYLDIREGTVNGNTTVTDSTGKKYETDGTGKGIIANTYTGVNVRTGPGTGYAASGKLLTGTIVDILETANARKWGRTAQGWICMDYVTMVSYNEAANTTTTTNKGTTVESFDKAEKTTTTAVYTGALQAGTAIYRNPVDNEGQTELIRTTTGVENITMYELAKVTNVVHSDGHTEGNTTVNTTTTVTGYWARINEGWVKDPATTVSLNALDEKVHTQTGVDRLNVRREPDENVDNVFDVLVQGDQVKVTALRIIGDKVWGRIETANGTGWIRLDYMSEGEVYVKKPVQQTTPPANNVLNNLGQTSTVGGYVTNNSGYRYTGKVIRANEVNVRANPSTTAKKTTSLKNGAALVIYETTIAENMAWGRCDAGWVYLYYVDLTPSVAGAVDARVVFNDNTIIYSDVNASAVAGSYARMSTVDIYEIVGKMARTDKGWINTDNLL